MQTCAAGVAIVGSRPSAVVGFEARTRHRYPVQRRMSSGCASRLGGFIPRTSGPARWGGLRRDGIMVDVAWRPRTRPPRVPQGGPMSPDDSGSVTHWLGALRGGDLDAAQPLWERYFARL